MTSHEDTGREGDESSSFVREVGTSLKGEVRSWFRFAAWGAVLGAVALGAAGLWYFGAIGLAVGLAVGAVVGGLGAWLFYLYGTSLST